MNGNSLKTPPKRRLRNRFLPITNALTTRISAGASLLDSAGNANVEADTGGLDDVRAFNWVKQGGVDVYGNWGTKDVVYKDFSYAFAAFRYPGVPEIDYHVVEEEPFYIDDIRVTPVPVLHYKMPVLGFRIGNFAYITDAKTIPEPSMELLKGVEYLVVNALRKEEHLSHFTLGEALAVVERLKPRRTWLTHIGHQMGLASEVAKELPMGVELAYDTFTVEIPDE